MPCPVLYGESAMSFIILAILATILFAWYKPQLRYEAIGALFAVAFVSCLIFTFSIALYILVAAFLLVMVVALIDFLRH